MKMRWMSLDCHVAFPMMTQETREQAEDRLLAALDNGCPGVVMSWTRQEIEEAEVAEDEPDIAR